MVLKISKALKVMKGLIKDFSKRLKGGGVIVKCPPDCPFHRGGKGGGCQKQRRNRADTFMELLGWLKDAVEHTWVGFQITIQVNTFRDRYVLLFAFPLAMVNMTRPCAFVTWSENP